MSDFFRISAANLATSVRWVGEAGQEAAWFAIKNPKKHGVFQALGGAMQLSPTGRSILQDRFNADHFEKDGGIVDARFVVPAEMVSEVFSFLSFELGRDGKSACFTDPISDIRDEMVGKEFSDVCILSERQFSQLDFGFKGLARQGGGPRTSERAGDFPTIRLFAIYQIVMPRSLATDFTSSKVVRLLSDEEIGLTKGGCCKGTLRDGSTLSDNVFQAFDL